MREFKQNDKLCFKVVWEKENKVLYIESVIKSVSSDGSDLMIFPRGLEPNFVFLFRSGEWIFYDRKTWLGLLMNLVEDKVDFPANIPQVGEHIAYELGNQSKGRGIVVNFRYMLKIKNRIIEAGIGIPLVENKEIFYWTPAKWYQINKTGKWHFKDEKNKRFSAKVEKI